MMAYFTIQPSWATYQQWYLLACILCWTLGKRLHVLGMAAPVKHTKQNPREGQDLHGMQAATYILKSSNSSRNAPVIAIESLLQLAYYD